jgi:hypothetical protein
MAKELLTVSGVALRYQIPESRVRRLADAGVLPHTRDSTARRVFIEREVARVLTPRDENQKR